MKTLWAAAAILMLPAPSFAQDFTDVVCYRGCPPNDFNVTTFIETTPSPHTITFHGSTTKTTVTIDFDAEPMKVTISPPEAKDGAVAFWEAVMTLAPEKRTLVGAGKTP